MRFPDRLRIVPISKLRDYCLSEIHDDGRHKARVFRAALGVTVDDAEWLRDQILKAAEPPQTPFVPLRQTSFGWLLRLDFTLTTRHGTAVIQTGWIAPLRIEILKLTTCLVR